MDKVQFIKERLTSLYDFVRPQVIEDVCFIGVSILKIRWDEARQEIEIERLDPDEVKLKAKR